MVVVMMSLAVSIGRQHISRGNQVPGGMGVIVVRLLWTTSKAYAKESLIFYFSAAESYAADWLPSLW